MATARQPARYEMFTVTRCRVTSKKMGAALASAIQRHQLTSGSPSSSGAQAATTTDICPCGLRVRLTRIPMSCPSAVRKSISRSTEKFSDRLRISSDTCGCLMPRISPACTCVRSRDLMSR